jgi:hypothetical protein
MNSQPEQVVQFLKDMICALLSRVSARVPCKIRLAFCDDSIQCILFWPVDFLDSVVQGVALGRVVLRRRVDEVAWGNG